MRAVHAYSAHARPSPGQLKPSPFPAGGVALAELRRAGGERFPRLNRAVLAAGALLATTGPRLAPRGALYASRVRR